MDIPPFPESRPLDISDKERFDAAFAADPPEISEFTFTNLYSWRNAYGFSISLLDGFVILSGESGGKRYFFKPIGTGDVRSAMARLAGEHVPFIRVPEADAALLTGMDHYHAREDRDNADYLYSVRELIELKGKRFDGKRNLIKKFKRNNEYAYLKLDGNTSRDCLDFQDLWCETKSCSTEKSLSDEHEAVRTMCHNFDLFGLVGGAISTGGRIAAVAVGQRLNPQTMVMHVLKALPDIPGLYQAMHNEFLSREGAGYEFVNMEQDLGVEGLRKAKLSYQPVRLIGKYRLDPR